VLHEGTEIGRYTIVERIAHGGMGTVYRARDTRLDRDVALKFVYPYLASDPEGEARLVAEARAAASLQHPNICVIHEIGETPDGHPFIAMALCDGETLKQKLKRGAIEPGEAVSIATQVARGLGAAHSHHIIHRDVKPGNIILEPDGMVKLLDFGLAKSSDVSVTRPGLTPGTVAYMSPEQIRGEPVDHRSDLWSLGVVLYEMVAGRRPFRGGDDRVILQAILHEDPERIASVAPDVPEHVAGVIERLLRKDPVARYDSAAEVISDLAPVAASRRRPSRAKMVLAGVAAMLVMLVGLTIWRGKLADSSLSGAIASGNAEPSIAVLPLRNLSADSLDAVFAVGLTEDLIATLARAGGVRVIASTSTAGFRDSKMDVRQIAESLGVSNILEGGIQKSGSNIRVELRLISARDGSTTWSQAYDRNLKDMFVVQDEVVRTVAGELGLRFDKDRQLLRHGTRSMAAYELYLRGSDPLLLRSQAGVWKALEYFRQAIAADSTYAAAHAGLALVQVRRGRTTADPGMPLDQLYDLAENSARKAVALDDSLPEAHHALGRVLEVRLKIPEAEREIRRAIALDPTRSVYHRSLGYVLAWTGRYDLELEQARRALETDPLNPYAQLGLGAALSVVGRHDEGLVYLDRLAAIQPPLQALAFVKAQVYARQQRLPEAIAALRPQAEAGDPLFRGLFGHMLARAGQRDEANQVLSELIARSNATGIGAFQIAMVYTGLGDLDQAFAWLDKSIDDRSISSMVMGPVFEVLHRDPRFQKFRARLGLSA
jgi:TolB-like protein/Flp pilus assembly protein TadD